MEESMEGVIGSLRVTGLLHLAIGYTLNMFFLFFSLKIMIYGFSCWRKEFGEKGYHRLAVLVAFLWCFFSPLCLRQLEIILLKEMDIHSTRNQWPLSLPSSGQRYFQDLCQEENPESEMDGTGHFVSGLTYSRPCNFSWLTSVILCSVWTFLKINTSFHLLFSPVIPSISYVTLLYSSNKFSPVMNLDDDVSEITSKWPLVTRTHLLLKSFGQITDHSVKNRVLWLRWSLKEWFHGAGKANKICLMLKY